MSFKIFEVAILGLGYVGSELLSTIHKNKINVVGYDIDEIKINKLQSKYNVSNNQEILKKKNIYIICVPTPIDNKKKPDLKFLKKSCEIVSKYLNNKPIVIFESTVYPGVTEEICVKTIEKYSKKKLNKDFYVGYSPERYSPGEKKQLKDIDKLVSASNKKIAIILKNFYSKFINRVHVVQNIKIAELSKNFENCQRDINISLFNELYVYCKKIGINYSEVINACKTKWNFNSYYPGLVGGHCISVDPYYLIFDSKNKKVPFNSLKISRKINNNFVNYIYNQICKLIQFKGLSNKNILLYGLTYKPNTSDLRNSGANKIYKKLKTKFKKIVSFDPYINKKNDLNKKKFSIIIVLVEHDEFTKNIDFYRKRIDKNGIVYNPFND